MAKSKLPQADIGPFGGFGPEALSFLEDLGANQNREWFLAHKEIYDDQIRRPMESLVETLSLAFAAHDVPLTGSAKTSLFRINRDVRFAKDKSPYKTNAGAVMSRDGTKGGIGILYIQVGGDEGAFMALGFYGPEPEDLTALRQAVATDPGRWRAVEAALDDAGLVLSRGSPMVRMPKGYEAFAGTAVADVLKYRSLVVSRQVAPTRIGEPAFVDDIVAFARAGLPLLDFGRRAIDRARGARRT